MTSCQPQAEKIFGTPSHTLIFMCFLLAETPTETRRALSGQEKMRAERAATRALTVAATAETTTAAEASTEAAARRRQWRPTEEAEAADEVAILVAAVATVTELHDGDGSGDGGGGDGLTASKFAHVALKLENHDN